MVISRTAGGRPRIVSRGADAVSRALRTVLPRRLLPQAMALRAIEDEIRKGRGSHARIETLARGWSDVAGRTGSLEARLKKAAYAQETAPLTGLLDAALTEPVTSRQALEILATALRVLQKSKVRNAVAPAVADYLLSREGANLDGLIRAFPDEMAAFVKLTARGTLEAGSRETVLRLAELRSLQSRFANDAEIAVLRARTLSALGRVEELRALADGLPEGHRAHVQVRQSVPAALVKAGRLDEALSEIDRLATTGQGADDHRTMRADILEKYVLERTGGGTELTALADEWREIARTSPSTEARLKAAAYGQDPGDLARQIDEGLTDPARARTCLFALTRAVQVLTKCQASEMVRTLAHEILSLDDARVRTLVEIAPDAVAALYARVGKYTADGGAPELALQIADALSTIRPDAGEVQTLRARAQLLLGRAETALAILETLGTAAFENEETVTLKARALAALGRPDAIAALAGRLERIPGVRAKVLERLPAAFVKAERLEDALALLERLEGEALGPEAVAQIRADVLETHLLRRGGTPEQLAELASGWDSLVRTAKSSTVAELKSAIFHQDEEGLRAILASGLPDRDRARPILVGLRQAVTVCGKSGAFGMVRAVARHLLCMPRENLAALYRERPAETRGLFARLGSQMLGHLEFGEALDLCTLALAMNPGDIDALCTRAHALQELGRFSEAEQALEEAVAASPDDLGVRATQMKLLSGQGRHREAADTLGALSRNGAISTLELANLAAAGQMTEQAEALFQAALAETPDDHDTNGRAVDFLYRHGRWGRVISLFEKRPELRSRFAQIDRDVHGLRQATGLSVADILSDPDAFRPESVAYEELCRQAVAAPFVTTSPASREARLAIVISGLGPGGAERQCLALIDTLMRDLHAYGLSELGVFCANLARSERDRFLLDRVRQAGVEPVGYRDRNRRLEPDPAVASWMRPFGRQQAQLHLRRALAAYQPDVVHAFLDDTILNAGLVSLQLGARRFVARWGSMPPAVSREVSERTRDNSIYFRRAYRALVAHHPDACFYANSRLTSNAYADWIGVDRERFGVIHNGLDLDGFCFDGQARAGIRARLGIADDALVIGTAIRMSSEKRPLLWLDVAEEVARRTPGTEFVLVGDGPLIETVRRRAPELSHARVHVVGVQNAMAGWFSAMDVVLMTSSVEGISNTVVEAQSLGRPVVGFDVGGMSEAVCDGTSGFLVPDGNVATMVERLVALATEPGLLERMGHDGRGFVRDRFDARQMARRTARAYHRAGEDPCEPNARASPARG